MESKVLFREGMTLKVSDIILEVNRFNSKDFTIYQIEEIDSDGTYMYLKPLKRGYKNNYRLVGADIGAHYYKKNSRILTYILKAGNLLYGKV